MKKKTKNFLFSLMWAVFLFFMGYDTYSNHAINVYYGYYIELDLLYIPIVSLFFIGGLYVLYKSFKVFISNENLEKKHIEYSICPQCEESYFYSELDNGICPKCNIKTIDIEKYYQNNNT